MLTSVNFDMTVLLLLTLMMMLRMLKLLIHLTIKTMVMTTMFHDSFLDCSVVWSDLV